MGQGKGLTQVRCGGGGKRSFGEKQVNSPDLFILVPLNFPLEPEQVWGAARVVPRLFWEKELGRQVDEASRIRTAARPVYKCPVCRLQGVLGCWRQNWAEERAEFPTMGGSLMKFLLPEQHSATDGRGLYGAPHPLLPPPQLSESKSSYLLSPCREPDGNQDRVNKVPTGHSKHDGRVSDQGLVCSDSHLNEVGHTRFCEKLEAPLSTVGV